MARAKAAMILLGVTILLTFVLIGTNVSRLGLLHRVQAGEKVDVATANDLARQEKIVGALCNLGFLASWVLFLVWEYRAYENLEGLRPPRMRFSPAASVAWYFCPIVNLWIPCQAMLDIWRGSGPVDRARGAGFVVLWWVVNLGIAVLTCTAAWMAGSVIGQARMTPLTASLVGSAVRAVWLILAGNIGVAVYAILTLVLIWRISKGQVNRDVHIVQSLVAEQAARA
jgi:hypothetical protein